MKGTSFCDVINKLFSLFSGLQDLTLCDVIDGMFFLIFSGAQGGRFSAQSVLVRPRLRFTALVEIGRALPGRQYNFTPYLYRVYQGFKQA